MHDSPCTWQCERVIASSPRACQDLMDEILGQLQLLRWSDRDVFGVHLALEEALANAIEHGNRQDPTKHIRIRCSVSPEMVHLEIADEGCGFDPSLLPDPTHPAQIGSPKGRGIMLMRSFMSRVEFNDVGNCVLMEKYRSPSDRQAGAS